MNLKWRWWMSLVAIGIVVVAVTSLFYPKDSEEDSPRLVFVGQEQRYGQNVVVFRFVAPIHGKAFLKRMSTENVPTGVRSRPILVGMEPEPKVLVGADVGLPAYPVGSYSPQEMQFPSRHPFVVEKGASAEYHIQAPNDPVWRLRCEAIVAGTVYSEGPMDDWLRRIRRSWRFRSLRYLGYETMRVTESPSLWTASPSGVGCDDGRGDDKG